MRTSWNKGLHIQTNTGRTHFKKGHIPFSKGIHIQTNTGRTHFKKGFTPWNKNTKGVMKAWNKGKKFPEFSGEKSSHWKGGKFIDNHGYVFIYKPNHPFANKKGYILEHRFVKEKQLGRYLQPQERVHHFNGIKTDNRPKNLKWFSNESKHQKFHHLLKSKK